MPKLTAADKTQMIPVNVTVTSIEESGNPGTFVYDLTNMKAEISDPSKLNVITNNEEPVTSAGGSSSHSSRGGKSRKGRKSKKGGKSKKARKSLRRK